MIYKNVGDMCFIPMNAHNELVCQLRWQHLSPVVSTFSTSIRLLSSFFTKHCILPPSFSPFLSICPSLSRPLSVIPHPVFLIIGLSLQFGDVDVFFLHSKVLCRTLDHRRTGWEDQLTPPPKLGRYDIYSGRRQHICLTTSVTERNK